MDIWQMRYFIQIYRDKNLTKAAKNLFISEQGLSKAIKNIEDEFHITLFERSARGLNPTIHSEVLLEKVQKILNDYDDMIFTFTKSTLSNKKLITLGIKNLFYFHRLNSIISNFQEENPDVTLEFIEIGAYTFEKYLEDNLIDVCILDRPEQLNRFSFTPIAEFDVVLLVNKGNALSNKDIVNVKDLENEAFIMPSNSSRIRKTVTDLCNTNGFHPNIVYTTSQLDMIIELVELDKGISFLPNFNIFKVERMSKNIGIVMLDNNNFKNEVGFIYHKYKNMNCSTRALIDYCVKNVNLELI